MDAVLGVKEKWTAPYCTYGEGHFSADDNEMRRLRKSYT
jgi:hypothetical protein